MELKNLFTVKKVIETGNYYKAAEALNYAQSTVTFQIKQVERELGVKLFLKKGNRMILTDQGMAIMPKIENVIDSVSLLFQSGADSGEYSGVLKIAAAEFLATYKLPPVLKSFTDKAPGVRLEIDVLDCYDIFDAMCDYEYDIAFHYSVADYPKPMTLKKLEDHELVLVGHADMEEADLDFSTEMQRKNLCHIYFDPTALTTKILNRYLTKKNISLEHELCFGTIESVINCVKNGLGIAFLPRMIVEDDIRRGTLQEIRLDMTESITACYAFRGIEELSPAAKLFLQEVENAYPYED